MAVELFGSAVTRPDAVFCDTSFLLDLLTHEVASVGPLIEGLTPDKATRAAEAATFFRSYASQGTDFVSSPYTFQELTQVLGKGVLRASKAKVNRWKDLEDKDPTTFAALHSVWMAVVEDSWQRIQQNGISFTVPAGSGEEPEWGVRADSDVVEAACLLKLSYPSLDPADTFHIAMGVACGLEWFAALDEAWKAVAEINVFCYQ